MTIPTPDTIVPLQRLIPQLQEMLNYCALKALETQDSMEYREATGELIYYLKLDDLDKDLFEMLLGTEEIWIVESTDGGS
jgi:hypothetical protein